MAQGLTGASEEREGALHHAKHVLYWKRNLKTLLPHHYTSNDQNRMALSLFILSALDILGALDDAVADGARQGYIEHVYSCQLPKGCFRDSPGTDLGDARNQENEKWDPPHLPGTFFALLILLVLGDDLVRVKRREILVYLTKLQRPNGSFGSHLGENDRVQGGSDPRFGYMSAGIRWMLRGNLQGPIDGVPDIDVDMFVRCTQQAETYDGGISDAPFHEAHAGFTSCTISALAFLDRLTRTVKSSKQAEAGPRGPTDVQATLRWLMARLTLTLDVEDEIDTQGDETDSSVTCHDAHSFVNLNSFPSEVGKQSSLGNETKTHFERQWVGFNGRCNKIADTCYAYWVCNPLKLLGHLDLIDPKPIRRWLLERTQHTVGGFGKMPGDPPDILHSCLGLVVCAMFGEEGLGEVDSALCITVRAKQHLESLSWRRKLLGAASGSTEAVA